MTGLDPSLLHPQETERLAVVADLDLFGVEADEEFAPLLRLAAKLAGTNMALVTLIGAHHQWHAGVFGAERDFVARADAMCSHTILGDDVLHVPDTTLDPRFRDNPHVGIAGDIRMYAGAPLVVRGLPVGALCVVDDEARTLPAETLSALRELASVAVGMLELRQRSRDLEEANDALADANDDLAQFAQICAHDLKAPLAVILGYAQLMVHSAELVSAEELHEWAVVVEDRSRALSDIVNGLLAQTRGEFDAAPVDLEAVMAEVELRLSDTMQRAGARVRVERPLPTVHGDRIQLARMLQNLVANAVKFSRPGLSPEVVVRGRIGDDGSWCLEVADNGIGIPAAARERIAQRGVRLKEAMNYPGHGIGLEACRRIAEAHGGRLEFGDTPGGGATISVVCAEPAPSAAPGAVSPAR